MTFPHQTKGSCNCCQFKHVTNETWQKWNSEAAKHEMNVLKSDVSDIYYLHQHDCVVMTMGQFLTFTQPITQDDFQVMQRQFNI